MLKLKNKILQVQAMKLKNIEVGDLVEAKSDITFQGTPELKIHAGDVCEVVKLDTDGYPSVWTVFIELKSLKKWVSHKDLRKHIPKVSDVSELIGSDLARALKNRNQWVLAYVSNESDADAVTNRTPAIITGSTDYGLFHCNGVIWTHAVAINHKGQLLIANESGL